MLRGRRGERGFTMIEVIVVMLVLVAVMVPLSNTFVSGLRSTYTVADRVAKADDSQRLSAAWTQDVQSVDLAGVNANVCGTIASGETAVVSFSWGSVAAVGPVRTATWLVRGSGPDARLLRRFCAGGIVQGTRLIAADFMDSRSTVAAAVHGPTATPAQFCTVRNCTITIDGNYRYSLTVHRRLSATGNPSSGPTPPLHAVSALPESSGSSAAWAVGPACGVYYYSGSGSTISKITIPVALHCTSALYGVVAVSANVVYAVGANGTVLRCTAACSQPTGGTWTKFNPTFNTLYAVTVSEGLGSNGTDRGPDKVLAVGAAGTLIVCSTACAGGPVTNWAPSTSGAFGGATLTGVAMGQSINDPNRIALIVGRGMSDSTHGNIWRCTQSGCTTPAAVWTKEPASRFSSATGQLTSVAVYTNNGNHAVYTIVGGDGGVVLTCRSCSDMNNKFGAVASGVGTDDVTAVTTFKGTGTGVVTTAGSMSSCDGTNDACMGAQTLRKSGIGRLSGVTRTRTGGLVYMVGQGWYTRNSSNVFTTLTVA